MPRLTLNLAGARIRKTDLSFADLSRANLSRADLSHAILRGANLSDAILDGTILVGTDLREVRNLTWKQLRKAVLDDSTMLPDYLLQEKVSAE